MLGDYETRSETLRLSDVLIKTHAARLTTEILGGSNAVYGAVEKHRSIRGRRDVLSWRAVHLFRGSDCEQAPEFPLGHAPVRDFQGHVHEISPRGRGTGTDRSRAPAAEIPCGTGGLGGHSRV